MFVRETSYHGEKCIEMDVSGYYALLAPNIGSNMLRLYDSINDVEILRFDDSTPIHTIRNCPEIYGLPIMYLPNRLDKGRLKTSDGEYIFPMNEMNLQNYIHGFIHRRSHTVIDYGCDNDKGFVKTEYIYDHKDEMFVYYPLKFKLEVEYILDDEGLSQTVTITNLSDKMLPIGLGCHTTMKAPFNKNSKGENVRLKVPALMKCELNERCLPTEKILSLNKYDKQYAEGTMVPVNHNISNDMYITDTFEYNGRQFRGVLVSDIDLGINIGYEVSKEYGFFIIWNDNGDKGYFCPEPMTWMINAPNIKNRDYNTGYREISPNEVFSAKQRIFTERLG